MDDCRQVEMLVPGRVHLRRRERLKICCLVGGAERFGRPLR